MAKKDLLAQAESLGLEVDSSWTVPELEGAITDAGATPGQNVTDAERVCPECGELHASSIIPANEIDSLQGLRLSALPKSDTYRVFVHTDSGEAVFSAVPHKE